MKINQAEIDDREAARNRRLPIKTSWLPFGVWAIAMAVLVAVAYLVPTIQRSLVATPPPSTVTVGSRDSDMRQAVRAILTIEPPEELVSRTSGIVSGVWISAGDVVEPGSPIMTVNGIMVTAFGQDIPLYRPLSRGDTGADVASLRQFLYEFGVLDSSSDSTQFDRSVSDAVRKFQASVGAPVDGVFLPEYVVFLPSEYRLTATVGIRLGDLVSSGDVVASATPSLTGVSFLPASENGAVTDFGPGSLVFTVGDRRISLSSIAPPTEELKNFQAVLPSRPSSEEQGQPANTVTVEGVLSLQEPRSFGVVPSGSLFLARSGAKCLFVLGESGSSDGLVAVETESAAIAFGELGATYIDPDLVGLKVVRDPTMLDDESIALCK